MLITLLLGIVGSTLTAPSASASTVSRVEVAEHRQIVIVDTDARSGTDQDVAEPSHLVPTRFINIKVLTKSQATAIAIALKTAFAVVRPFGGLRPIRRLVTADKRSVGHAHPGGVGRERASFFRRVRLYARLASHEVRGMALRLIGRDPGFTLTGATPVSESGLEVRRVAA